MGYLESQAEIKPVIQARQGRNDGVFPLQNGTSRRFWRTHSLHRDPAIFRTLASYAGPRR